MKEGKFNWIYMLIIMFLLAACSMQPTPVKPTYPQIRPTRTPSAPDISDFGCPRGCWGSKLGCYIKGNISIDSGEKIYHMPGQEYYDQTKISPEYGERWFCTEAEAIMNGWRKAYK